MFRQAAQTVIPANPAWTRYLYAGEQRRAWRWSSLDPAMAESTLIARDNPLATLELNKVRPALMELMPPAREALVLVSAGGLSYEEAATICGCAVGTMKSRVNRAKAALVAILDRGDFRRDLAPAANANDVIADDFRKFSQLRDDSDGQVRLVVEYERRF